MAIATTPYTPNDYQAVSSFRPYELPINDIVRTVTAQNKFWDEGAARVKSLYENALGLSLTSEQNREVLKDFMKNADKQIQKLSTMNLADPSVQREGSKVFEPLFQDKAIMYDDTLTKLKRSILSDADNYKVKKLSKDGPEGEGYSDINLSDALDGFEEFNSNTPRDEQALEKLYNKLRDKRYVPFYDMSKDLSDALDNCKGSVNENSTPDGLNDNITKSSGITASQARMCLESSLSLNNKAMEQIAINARVNYKNNKPALYERVVPYLENEVENYENLLSKYQTEKLALVNSKKATPEQLDAYDKVINQFTTERDNARKHYQKVQGGDYSDIDHDYNTWAVRMYKRDVLDNYASPRATYSLSVTSRGNAGRIAEYKEQGANDRLLANFLHDKEMVGLESEAKLQEKMIDMLYGAGSGSGNDKMSATDRVKLSQKYGPLLQKMGFNFGLDTFSYLGKGVEQEPITRSALQGKLDENFYSSLNDLHDMTQIMQSIDGATDMVEAIKNLPSNPSQKDYLKAMEVANIYLEGRAKQLNGLDKLTGKDQALLTAINSYKEKVAYSNSLNSIMEDAISTAKQDKGLFEKFQTGMNQIQYNIQPFTSTSGEQFSKERMINIITGIDQKYGVRPYKAGNTSGFEFFDKSTDRDVFIGGVPTQNRTAIGEYFNLIRQKDADFNGKVDEKLRKNTVVNKLVYGAYAGTDIDVTERMLKFVPGSASKNFKYVSKTIDPETGDVAFEVYEQTKTGEKPVGIENLGDFQDKFGKSLVSEGSMLRIGKEGQLIMNIPELRTIKKERLDESVDLVKEALEIKAKATKKPISQEVYTSRTGKRYRLEAVPLSSGTVYTIKGKLPTESTWETMDGFDNLTKDQVNAAILHFKKLDYLGDLKK